MSDRPLVLRGQGARLAIHELAGTIDHPTYGGRRELAAISPEYTARLTGWLDYVIPGRD